MLWSLFLLPTILFSSCYKYSDELYDAEAQFVSLARFDPAQKSNFDNYQTIYIADSIMQISSTTGGLIVMEPIKNSFTTNIVNQIERNLDKNLGGKYTIVPNATDADLVLALYSFNITTASYSYYYPIDWYYWDWYWYYPAYYYSYYTSYTTGTLLMNMGDVKNKTVKNEVPVVWVGSVSGILTGTHTTAEMNSAINDCFQFDGSPFKK